VVVLGDSHIGKTSLVTRFAEGYYRENSRPATVGAFFVTKRIQSSDNVPTKIQIWDTAGQESFRAMAPMFYKNAAAVVVCYDVTRRESFEGMRKWLDEVRTKVRVGEEVVVAIAALKTDLLEDDDRKGSGNRAAVPEHEAEQLAEALGVLYLPTSAKTNRNVNALFQCVADRVLQMQTNSIGQSIGAADGNLMMGGGMSANGNQYDRTSYPGGNAGINAVPNDGRITISSPRKRDQFDKYYASQHSNNDERNSGHHHRDGTPTKEGDASIPLKKSRSGSGRKKSSRGGGRAGTPSTDASTVGEEGSHPLLAVSVKEKWKKRGGKKEGACVEEVSYNACQVVSCGTVDGSSGCTVQ